MNELVKTFGSLKVPAALMVLSAAFFAGAFGLAWKEPAAPSQARRRWSPCPLRPASGG